MCENSQQIVFQQSKKAKIFLAGSARTRQGSRTGPQKFSPEFLLTTPTLLSAKPRSIHIKPPLY